MRFFFLVLSLLLPAAVAEERAGKTNVPPDPFQELEDFKEVPDYPVELDRSRGAFTIDAKDGEYKPGSHFANWLWTMTVERGGNYYVGLLYESSRPKLGIQVKVGENVLKSYASRTSERTEHEPLVLGMVYLAEPGEYPVMMLTGDQSNGTDFQVKGLRLIPAPESASLGQSIDGEIVLEAKAATTYSEVMQYDSKPEKDCLGGWSEREDWAEWKFDISVPGEFEVTLSYGCPKGDEGSEIALYINDQVRTFTVEATGGSQVWKEISLPGVMLDTMGENKVAVVPQSKAGKAVMDLQKIVFTPTP